MGHPAEKLRPTTYADLEAVPPHQVAEDHREHAVRLPAASAEASVRKLAAGRETRWSVRAWRGRAPGTWEKVLGWLVKLGIPKRALRDVAQEVFEAAWRSRPSYDPAKARPERWLNGVAVHVAAHHWDKPVQRREMLTLDEMGWPEEIDENPSAEEAIELEEKKAICYFIASRSLRTIPQGSLYHSPSSRPHQGQ